MTELELLKQLYNYYLETTNMDDLSITLHSHIKDRILSIVLEHPYKKPNEYIEIENIKKKRKGSKREPQPINLERKNKGTNKNNRTKSAKVKMIMEELFNELYEGKITIDEKTIAGFNDQFMRILKQKGIDLLFWTDLKTLKSIWATCCGENYTKLRNEYLKNFLDKKGKENESGF